MADEWTDDEINEVILNFFTHSDKTTFQRMKDALSAVKRVPDGCCIMPIEPTEKMMKACDFVYGDYDDHQDVYSAMRNAYRRK